jgi:carbonic anhydrase
VNDSHPCRTAWLAVCAVVYLTVPATAGFSPAAGSGGRGPSAGWCACSSCSGGAASAEGLTGQSPIDIRSEDAVFAALPPLHFQYGTTGLTVVNTGSPDEFATVRATVPAGAGLVSVAGVAYALSQFHFHTAAEHLVNGYRAAMELHLVHQAADGTNLVVGRFIEVGAFNAALDPIFSDLPQDPNDPVSVGAFDLGALVPANLQSFRYDGSLTTPPFAEGVLWNLLAEPLTLSLAQIDAFRALFPDGNSRPVQPLDGRLVLTDVPGFAVPAPPSLALLGVAAACAACAAGVGRRRGWVAWLAA